MWKNISKEQQQQVAKISFVNWVVEQIFSALFKTVDTLISKLEDFVYDQFEVSAVSFDQYINQIDAPACWYSISS